MDADKPKFVIGIDPDVEKNGIAVLDTTEKSFDLIDSKDFFHTIHTISEFSSLAKSYGLGKVVVVLEDSDSTTNWHLKAIEDARMTLQSKLRKAAAIGHGSGMCHATQRHLQEAVENMGIEIQLQKPFKKSWMGKDGKITHDELAQFVKDLQPTTNQEGRDAALLAWLAAGLPIRIPASFYKQYWKRENIKKRAAKEMKQRMSIDAGSYNMRRLEQIIKPKKK